ncbi:hypothetical protein BGX31_006992 [Mortierella sp. GBA43]|nr:hypothetical protein BGX31_006992 [Mortierella sp. GBA43]
MDSDIRVYAKHLQTPNVIHQACIGNWTGRQGHELPGVQQGFIDIVFSKGSFLSMYRFTVHETEPESRPAGSLELVHEQSVFGTIKDITTLQCLFEPEDEDREGMDIEPDGHVDKPRLGYIPPRASSTVLVATSDSGVLSFLTFHCNEGEDGKPVDGQFYILKEIEIAEPGFDYSQTGARIAVDPTSRIMAVSALQDHIRLVILRSTRRSQFDPVEREEKIHLVTVETSTGPGVSNPLKHTFRSSLELPKRDLSENIFDNTGDALASDTFPLISACATPPPSTPHSADQTLYLGSDTSELYRINIQHLTLAMHFELMSGDRPVGNVMQVLARHQISAAPLQADMDQEVIINTDYLIYSGDHGDGGVLAIRDEEEEIELFAITEVQNSSPIMDFCVREPSFPGRDSLYVCSGMKSQGALKRIRSGVSIESSGKSGQSFFSGTTGLWSIKENDTDTFDSFIVVSFVNSTKLMRSGEGGSLDDIGDGFGLDLTQPTIHSGRLRDGMIFQVLWSGVVVAEMATGIRHTWQLDGVITSACLVKEDVLLLGQIADGVSRLLLLEFKKERVGDSEQEVGSFKILVSTVLKAEPTTIHCWMQGTSSPDRMITSDGDSCNLCCVGTLEPGVTVYQIKPTEILEVYNESLAEIGLEEGAIPHSVCVLKSHNGDLKVLVGLREGSIIAYDWVGSTERQSPSTLAPGAGMALPRLFKLGVLPVKFVSTTSSTPSRTMILSDKLWQAGFDRALELHAILFDSEVTQACSFQTDDGQYSGGSYILVVDNNDIQLVTLAGLSKYTYQTVALGRTPRKILDVTSKKLLLVASVPEGFPRAESSVQLIDPDRVSSEPEMAKQHVLAEFFLKSDEVVYCLAEWKIRRPNKSDAVYLCVGTGSVSPTAGSDLSTAAPKGRLILLSVRQSKKTDREPRTFKLDMSWAMVMSAPVFAISPFVDMQILVSSGSELKLMILDLKEKKLVEKASHRERWPIIQISTQGSMICTGSRRESICFYEYQPASGDEQSHDKITFLKSSKYAKMVSDCIAITPEFAVGVDLSGGIFGVGYSRDDDSNRQYTLTDRFSFHLGEIVNRIRLAKTWPADHLRSMIGIPLTQQSTDRITSGQPLPSGANEYSKPTLGQLSSWILVLWTTPTDSSATQLTQSSSEPTEWSSQALIGCSLIGSIIGLWRLRPQVYQILSLLQSTIQPVYECRPILGNSHDRFRSLSSPGSNTIDGDLMEQFLRLNHTLQVQLVTRAIGMNRIVDEWIHQTGMSPQEHQYLTSIWSQQAASTGPVECQTHQVAQGSCPTTNVICHILRYLQSVDWHQH